MPAITKPYTIDSFLCASAFSASLREKNRNNFSVFFVPPCLCVKTFPEFLFFSALIRVIRGQCFFSLIRDIIKENPNASNK